MLVKQLLNHFKMAAFLAAIFAHGPLVAESMESAYDLIARMAKASKELSYKGLFTYEYRGQLRSIKVVHLVREGETYERIVHMDGRSVKLSAVAMTLGVYGRQICCCAVAVSKVTIGTLN